MVQFRPYDPIPHPKSEIQKQSNLVWTENVDSGKQIQKGWILNWKFRQNPTGNRLEEEKKEDPDSILKHPTHRNQRKDEARSYKHRKSKIRGKNKGITMKRRIPEKVERGRNRRWDFTIDGKGMND